MLADNVGAGHQADWSAPRTDGAISRSSSDREPDSLTPTAALLALPPASTGDGGSSTPRPAVSAST